MQEQFISYKLISNIRMSIQVLKAHKLFNEYSVSGNELIL